MKQGISSPPPPPPLCSRPLRMLHRSPEQLLAGTSLKQPAGTPSQSLMFYEDKNENLLFKEELL